MADQVWSDLIGLIRLVILEMGYGMTISISRMIILIRSDQICQVWSDMIRMIILKMDAQMVKLDHGDYHDQDDYP